MPSDKRKEVLKSKQTSRSLSARVDFPWSAKGRSEVRRGDYIGRVEVSTYMRDDRKVARDADSAINVVLVEVIIPNFITREVF